MEGGAKVFDGYLAVAAIDFCGESEWNWLFFPTTLKKTKHLVGDLTDDSLWVLEKLGLH